MDETVTNLKDEPLNANWDAAIRREADRQPEYNRQIALDMAIRASPGDTVGRMLERAEEFQQFLTGTKPTSKVEPTEFTVNEGGIWYAWGSQRNTPAFHGNIHAIRFADGSVFDAINGWRRR